MWGALLVLWACVLGLGTWAVAGQSVIYAFTNFVGSPQRTGSADGTGKAALFFYPWFVSIGPDGTLYVADTYNNTIRKVTPSGAVTTLAGAPGQTGIADGTGSAARFNEPLGLVVNSDGNLFVADSVSSTIRMVTPDGVVTTVAGAPGQTGGDDGTGAAARFHYPRGLALDSAGNLYVADTWNQTIRKMTPDGTVTTLAGLAGEGGHTDGSGSVARFQHPSGLAVDSAGNIYVTDTENLTIRKISPAGWVTTFAGTWGSWGAADGPPGVAQFYFAIGLAVDRAGNLYVGDNQNWSVRKVTPDGFVTTVAGGQYGSADGVGGAARLDSPYGVALDSVGRLYVADWFNSHITRGIPVPVFTGFSASNGIGTWILDGILGGATVVVEVSTNLHQWSPVQTNVAGPFPSQVPVSRALPSGTGYEFLRAFYH